VTNNNPAQKPAAQRLQDALDPFGLNLQVVEFPASTHSAAEAAAVIGCSVAQIAKSIILRGTRSDRAILVVTSGTNRVCERKVEALLGEKPGKADADFVRARTGFAIGGVAPIGHSEAPIILLDQDLADHGQIWAAAGTPNAVFSLTPAQLVRLTGAEWADIRQV
jgi:prolyl-tRNA editing enzyme YbaK/EbsC (Cys-tRNA(Pro) deacylase)